MLCVTAKAVITKFPSSLFSNVIKLRNFEIHFNKK